MRSKKSIYVKDLNLTEEEKYRLSKLGFEYTFDLAAHVFSGKILDSVKDHMLISKLICCLREHYGQIIDRDLIDFIYDHPFANILDKYYEIYKFHHFGLSDAEIGKKFNCTANVIHPHILKMNRFFRQYKDMRNLIYDSMYGGEGFAYLSLIEELNLSTVPYNALKRANVCTVYELMELVRTKEIINIRNIGVDSFEEIEMKLNEFKLNRVLIY